MKQILNLWIFGTFFDAEKSHPYGLQKILMHYTRENMGIRLSREGREGREAEVPEEAVNQVGPNVQIRNAGWLDLGGFFGWYPAW